VLPLGFTLGSRGVDATRPRDEPGALSPCASFGSTRVRQAHRHPYRSLADVIGVRALSFPASTLRAPHLPRSLCQVVETSLGNRVLTVRTMAITNRTIATTAATSARPVRYATISRRPPRSDGKELAGMVE